MIIYIVLVILMIIISVLYFVPFDKPNEKVIDDCIFDLSRMKDASSLVQCRDTYGNLTRRWYDPENDWTVSDINSSYKDVCLDWCKVLSLPDECLVEGDDYSECINKLRPSCNTRSNPVARDGNNLLYVESRHRINCF